MQSNLMDHPVVRNMERTGYPDGKVPMYPHCPVCGAECDTVYYRGRHLEVICCDVCIRSGDAYEEAACFSGRAYEN